MLFAPFIREADGPLEAEIDIEAEIDAGPPRDLVPPNGVLLLARVDGAPAGIGGVRYLETEFAEVKSMYVSPAVPRHRPRPAACSPSWRGSRPGAAAGPSGSTPPPTSPPPSPSTAPPATTRSPPTTET